MNRKVFAALCSVMFMAVLASCATGGGGGGSADPKGPNLAKGKKATAISSEKEEMAAGMACDGRSDTRWGSDFFSDPAPAEAWWYVDLGAKSKISIITVNFEAAYGKEFDIQVSDDAKSWKTVLEVTNGKVGENAYALSAPAEGRYVKYQGKKRGTSYGHSFWELGVYEN